MVNNPTGISVGQSVTFTKAFTTVPKFAVLLKILTLQGGQTTQGYDIQIDTPTLAGVAFNLTDWTQQSLFRNLGFSWVAAVGQHLQFFPISLTLPADHLTQNIVFEIPFDYNTLVQWNEGFFEVAVTSVISSFVLTTNTSDYRVDMTIAGFNGLSYEYFGNGPRYILPGNAVYGPNSPFTSNGDQDVVLMWAGGFANTVIRSYLIFHRVQVGGAYLTGIVSVRTTDYDNVNSPSMLDTTNSSYNPIMQNPETAHIMGFESFWYTANSNYINGLTIMSPNGLMVILQHDTQSHFAHIRAFAASYSQGSQPPPPPPPSSCRSGCVCSDGVTCDSCISGSFYRVAAPVSVAGTSSCPCISGFYEDTNNLCQPCPRESNCETCHLNSGNVQCLSCRCSNHRELDENGACLCKTGYTEATPTAGAYCVRAAVVP